MKAAVYYETGGPEVFRYEDVPDPACGPDAVLIEVRAISIEGGDTLHRAGGLMAGRPHIVGYQCAGIVREVGANVTDRVPGQRVVAVMMYGSHAELAVVPAVMTWVLPDGLDLKLGACVPIPFGTADDCLFEFGRLRAGETALIHAGAGGVGIAAIQLAKRAGATVLATASSDAKLERLKEFGLDHGINYRDEELCCRRTRTDRGTRRRRHRRFGGWRDARGQHRGAGLPRAHRVRRVGGTRRLSPQPRRPAAGQQDDHRHLPRRRR